MNFNELGRTLIVAEIGVNHEGDVDVAADLVRQAAVSGADAVKLQTFEIQHYISSVQPERRDRTARFELTRADFRRLASVARESGLILVSTPLGFDDVDFLDELIPFYKVSSGDLTHLQLVRLVASKGKPLIVSTGLGTREEIAAAVEAVTQEQPDARESGHLMLMHCVSAYPTPPDEAGLANIRWLSEEFDLPIGYSDHTLGTKACELAVAAGAVAVEKHFTYRKENQTFHDHALSADPQDLTELVKVIRHAEVYIGPGPRERQPCEMPMLEHMRRSLGAAVDIRAGQPLAPAWIAFLRPARGVSVDRLDEVLGMRLKRDVAAGDLIRDEDLET